MQALEIHPRTHSEWAHAAVACFAWPRGQTLTSNDGVIKTSSEARGRKLLTDQIIFTMHKKESAQ